MLRFLKREWVGISIIVALIAVFWGPASNYLHKAKKEESVFAITVGCEKVPIEKELYRRLYKTKTDQYYAMYDTTPCDVDLKVYQLTTASRDSNR